MSLERVQRLLAELGDPQDKLPPVVHVAGTNGKGSTVAFLRAFLEAGGLRVHAYTSPHLVRFHERIRLAGRLIEEKHLAALLEECERFNRGAPITFFEITTAAALLGFARAPADIVLLEVGLGGRFDATNVIARPAVTVVTPVSLDHQHFLGETIAAIAFEKAGILKKGVPAVVAAQPPEAETVIEARARELGAPVFREGKEWNVSRGADGGLAYRGKRDLDLPPPGLLGEHQYGNAGTALAALDCLGGLKLGADALARGVKAVEWPARLQRLAKGPLVSALPPDCELWLDGAHNPAGGAALARFVAGWKDKPTRLVFGMLKTHDAAAFLEPLAPLVESLAAVAIPREANSLSAEEAAAAARNAGLIASAQPSLLAAVTSAARPSSRILICGSLYLAGRVLEENG
ncbi:MAG TPA: folylpolyglutamate synthase/dihydrofolate synthase family protein [Stellaceae bacterium]|nr:folylpolyglutamate synthase/dihydrofolate synthase family protein [Stellaceae bacterium]